MAKRPFEDTEVPATRKQYTHKWLDRWGISGLLEAQDIRTLNLEESYNMRNLLQVSYTDGIKYHVFSSLF